MKFLLPLAIANLVVTALRGGFAVLIQFSVLSSGFSG